jgi:hypothetical protein
MDVKWDSKTHLLFSFFEPFRPILALKLAKKLIYRKNKNFLTQNAMLNSNPLKKVHGITFLTCIGMLLPTTYKGHTTITY